MRFLLIVLLAFTLVRIGTSCDNNERTETIATGNAAEKPDGTPDPTAGEPTASGNADANGEMPGSDLKTRQYPKLKSPRVRVRANDRLSVFALPAAHLFTGGKNEISLAARQDLKRIAEVIKEQFPQGRVYVYVPAGEATRDADGGRAMEVKNWLVVQEHLDEARVFVPEGGKQPAGAPVLNEPTPAGEVRIIAVRADAR